MQGYPKKAPDFAKGFEVDSEFDPGQKLGQGFAFGLELRQELARCFVRVLGQMPEQPDLAEPGFVLLGLAEFEPGKASGEQPDLHNGIEPLAFEADCPSSLALD